MSLHLQRVALKIGPPGTWPQYLSSFWKFSTYPNKIGLILGFHQKFYWPPGSFNILMQPLILLYNIMDLNPI